MNLLLKNIVKKFGDKTVIDNFSHLFPHNTTTAIFGESGCGKTTLLRIISRLERDHEGVIDPIDYTVSVAFQEHRLFPGATVLENVRVAGDVNKGTELLIALGIDSTAFNKYPSELSGGMARRVSLARAILKNADVYLFDEPFSGLDPENAENTAKIIKEYCANKTCIVVTHNKELAEIFADEFLYL